MDITRFLPAESSAGMIEAGAAELTAKVTTSDHTCEAHRIKCKPQAGTWPLGMTGPMQVTPRAGAPLLRLALTLGGPCHSWDNSGLGRLQLH